VSKIAIDGIPLPVAPGLVYYLLYKPLGVVSTADDPQGRPTVVDLVPAETRVFPVGRLDADSEGLLLLTNDGDLTLRLTHPRFGVHKTYVVLVEGVVRDADIRRIVAGVELDDGPAAAVAARVRDRRVDESLVEVTMNEGRKREVRRMMVVVGHPVIRLVRTGIGPLRDTTLRPGDWRALDVSEVRALYAAGTEVPSAR
jgi:23S rRNA pseudouridine2605 synthase